MRSMLGELWHGIISPETVRSLRRNSESTSVQRSNTPEMKRLMEYNARYHDNIIATKSVVFANFPKSVQSERSPRVFFFNPQSIYPSARNLNRLYWNFYKKH